MLDYSLGHGDFSHVEQYGCTVFYEEGSPVLSVVGEDINVLDDSLHAADVDLLLEDAGLDRLCD